MHSANEVPSVWMNLEQIQKAEMKEIEMELACNVDHNEANRCVAFILWFSFSFDSFGNTCVCRVRVRVA